MLSPLTCLHFWTITKFVDFSFNHFSFVFVCFFLCCSVLGHEVYLKCHSVVSLAALCTSYLSCRYTLVSHSLPRALGLRGFHLCLQSVGSVLFLNVGSSAVVSMLCGRADPHYPQSESTHRAELASFLLRRLHPEDTGFAAFSCMFSRWSCTACGLLSTWILVGRWACHILISSSHVRSQFSLLRSGSGLRVCRFVSWSSVSPRVPCKCLRLSRSSWTSVCCWTSHWS